MSDLGAIAIASRCNFDLACNCSSSKCGDDPLPLPGARLVSSILKIYSNIRYNWHSKSIFSLITFHLKIWIIIPKTLGKWKVYSGWQETMQDDRCTRGRWHEGDTHADTVGAVFGPRYYENSRRRNALLLNRRCCCRMFPHPYRGPRFILFSSE